MIVKTIMKRVNIDISYTIYISILENIYDELGLTFVRTNSVNI